MIKKILITLAILIVLLLVGFGIFLATFDLNHYREFAQKQLSKALNYPVQIGSMRTKLSLIPTIQINNFKIFQNGADPRVIVDIPQMEAVVEILPLLKKKIEITKIDVLLLSMDLSLFSKNEKKVSENKEKTKTSSSGSSDLIDQLWVEEISVDRLLCRFMNGDKKEAVEFNKFLLKGLNKFKFQLVYDKKKINVEGSSGLLTRLIANPKSLPIDLKIKQGNASLTLKGQIGDLPNLNKIRIDANFSALKLATFLKSWDIFLPKFLDVNVSTKFSIGGNMQKMTLSGISLDIDKKALILTANGQATKLNKNPNLTLATKIVLSDSNFSQKIGFRPFEITADVSANKEKVSLKTIDYKAGRSDISGDIEIGLNNLPSIITNLSSSYLNLKDVLYEQQPADSKVAVTQKTTNIKEGFLIPNTKIDWSVLNKFSLKGKINIGHLFLTDHVTDYLNIDASPQLDKGRLISPFKGRILSGNIDGNIDVNANQKTASLKFKGQDLDLDKIRFLSKTIKGAKINADVSLDSKGNTFKELASNASGKLIIELLSGTIMDEWFNSLPATLSLAKQKSGLLDFSTADQKTDIVCGAINIPIKDGVLTSNEKIAVQTDALNFVANGQINLKNETLNLTIIPSLNQTRGMANQLLTSVQAVHFKGPWLNIEPTVDAGNVVENIAQITAQKLTGKKPQILTSTELCQKVLGRKIQKNTTTVTTTPQKQVQKTTQTKQPTSKKENLKQQLMQSLAQALQNKVKK